MKKFFSLVLLTAFVATNVVASLDYKANPLDARNILEEAYSPIWNAGFLIPEQEVESIKAAKGAPTYGEILWESADELFKELKISKKDRIYDLGCGTGKFITQAYLQTPAKKFVGVDLSQTRLLHAQNVQSGIMDQAKKVLGKRKFTKKKWEYRHENIVETDISDATVVYMCSTCYSDELMSDITERLSFCKKGLRVATLKQMPFHPNFKLVKTLTLPMTWSSGSPVYIYNLESTNKKVAQQKKQEIIESVQLAATNLVPVKEVA